MLFAERVSATLLIDYVQQFLLGVVPQANGAKRPYPAPACNWGSGFVAIKTSIKKGFIRVIVAPRVECRGRRRLSIGLTGLAG